MSPEDLRAEADLYADYETEHADLIRAAADRIEADAAIVAAARAWGAAHSKQAAQVALWQHERRYGIVGNTDAYKAMNDGYEALRAAGAALAAALDETRPALPEGDQPR